MALGWSARYVPTPPTYPARAGTDIRRRYQMKSTFSRPMSATPAAEPMTRREPPVPAQKAMSCQSSESGGYVERSYMPMDAATRGTLSTTADANPITVATSCWEGRLESRKVATFPSTPAESSAPMARRIPRKKSTPEVSILLRAVGTRSESRSSSPAWMASVRAQRTPRAESMPRYGGRPVRALKRGTDRSPATPVPKTSCPRGASSAVAAAGEPLPSLRGTPSVSASTSGTMGAMAAALITVDTIEGRTRFTMVGSAVTCPLIHSMVVVTSPIGVHAPPALAAITTMEPKSLRSSGSGKSLRRSETMTMVVVRLSRMPDMTKEMPLRTHSRERLLLVVMRSVTTLKPSCASTTSTMDMAPSRKKITSDTSETLSESWCVASARSDESPFAEAVPA
mmetsp:Transcript_13421/g.45372  ORF Transcript_13421/g.45372 Transcript_13421/m.45372 type:complete len:397 (+) Transcript_13421:81-1271(+)